MEDSTEMGGNKIVFKIGSIFTKVGKKITDKGAKTTITNPSCKLISPWALILNFTVNNTDKYQLITQGDYRNKYKEKQDTDNPIAIEEMFIVIKDNRKNWFLKA
jgi:hypothetical protein